MNGVVTEGSAKFGVKGNKNVNISDLADMFKANDENATLTWDLIAKSGAKYENYTTEQLDSIGNQDTNTFESIKVTVTAENDIAEQEYTFSNVWVLTVETFANETTIKDKNADTEIESGDYVAEGTELTFQWKAGQDDRSYGDGYHSCVNGTTISGIENATGNSISMDTVGNFNMPAENAAINTHKDIHS